MRRSPGSTALAGQPRDLPLLRSQLVACLDGPLAPCPPVAKSSVRARSANASIPIDVNWSWAARSWARVGAAIGGAGAADSTSSGSDHMAANMSSGAEMAASAAARASS